MVTVCALQSYQHLAITQPNKFQMEDTTGLQHCNAHLWFLQELGCT